MMPMMLGTLSASILSGQLIAGTGRYKMFPVFGTALVTAALLLLASLTAGISITALLLRLLLLGIGLGLVMQVLVLAVQNAVPHSELGAATSASMLFRLVGGSIGTAVLGVVFGASVSRGGGAAAGAEEIAAAMRHVFAAAAIVSGAGAILTWFIPEQPLRDTVAASGGDVGNDSGEALALPATIDSENALVRGLSILADRDVRRAYIAGIARRAGVDLMPISVFLLIRLGEAPDADLGALAAEQGITRERVAEGLAELRARGLLEPSADNVTAAGCEVFARLSEARRARLSELAAQWPPEQRAEIAAVLRGLARVLVPDAPARRE